TDAGYRQFLWSTRIEDGNGISNLPFPKMGGKNGLYYGLAAGDGVIYAAQGSHERIAVVSIDPDGFLKQEPSIVAKKGDFVAGLALDGRGRLYAANNYPPE